MTRETIELEYPVTVDGETVTELHIRRPKMGDIKRWQKHKNDMDRGIALISDLAEISPKVVEELDTADFKTVSDKVGEYMGGSED